MKDVLGRAIVPTTRDNFECYQLEATGDFGMTKAQLAQACGISIQGVENVIRNTNPKNYAPHMTSFIGQRVSLTRVVLPSGGKAKIILKWDFCTALMTYYVDKRSKKVDRIINEKSKLLPGEFKVENAERVVEDGVEYFVLKDGDRGMRLRALCRACKTSHGTVVQLISELSSPAYSDWASCFTKENIFLAHEVTRNGKRLTLLQIEFCKAVIAYYAAKRSDNLKARRNKRQSPKPYVKKTVSNVAYDIVDGIEIFTLDNGDQGMSQRGLARACNTQVPAIHFLIGNISSPSYSPYMNPFVGVDIILSRNVTKKGKSIILYRMDFCEAVMAYYEAKVQSKKKEDESVLKFSFNF